MYVSTKSKHKTNNIVEKPHCKRGNPMAISDSYTRSLGRNFITLLIPPLKQYFEKKFNLKNTCNNDK